ncbi:CBS domain-containing protein [bacterium]|nr:CBS domain-containing protein [bacterium]
MNALDHIVNIPLVDEKSSRQECIDVMFDLSCFDLPVFKDNKLHGTIRLKECIESKDEKITDLIIPGFASAYFNTHVLDLLSVYEETPFDSIAVLGDEFEYIGIITRKALIQCLSRSLTVDQVGAVLVVEMATHQYSSSEICRIIESENAQLLGLWIENVPDSGRIRANLKVNTKNAERVISSLLRFNYEVIASFGDDDYKENVEKRFQSLMKYLDI